MDVVLYQAEAGASADLKTTKMPTAANDNEVATSRPRWVPSLV